MESGPEREPPEVAGANRQVQPLERQNQGRMLQGRSSTCKIQGIKKFIQANICVLFQTANMKEYKNRTFFLGCIHQNVEGKPTITTLHCLRAGAALSSGSGRPPRNTAPNVCVSLCATLLGTSGSRLPHREPRKHSKGHLRVVVRLNGIICGKCLALSLAHRCSIKVHRAPNLIYH